MNDFWQILRIVNLVLLFACFMILIYKGTFKLILSPKDFHWDRLMNLLWVLLNIYIVSEVLVQEVEGGIRIPFTTLVSLLQLYVVLFKFHPKDESSCVK